MSELAVRTAAAGTVRAVVWRTAAGAVRTTYRRWKGSGRTMERQWKGSGRSRKRQWKGSGRSRKRQCHTWDGRAAWPVVTGPVGVEAVLACATPNTAARSNRLAHSVRSVQSGPGKGFCVPAALKAGGRMAAFALPGVCGCSPAPTVYMQSPSHVPSGAGQLGQG